MSNERELTIDELDAVSGGFLGGFPCAHMMVANIVGYEKLEGGEIRPIIHPDSWM
jgi:bacteriocin-like protein